MADARCKLEATGEIKWPAKTTLTPLHPWAAQYNIWLLTKLTPKGVSVFFPVLPNQAHNGTDVAKEVKQ